MNERHRWLTSLCFAGFVPCLMASLSSLVPGCSSEESSSAAPVDSGPSDSAAVDGAVTEGGARADADAAPTCDLGPVPTMPALTSEVVIEGEDGGAAPVPTGGDEAGLWTYRRITVYLPGAAKGQIDPSGSKVEGKGFIELGGGKLRQLVDTTTTLSTSLIGIVVRASTTKVLGTYVAAGNHVTFTITCRESSGESTSLDEVGFSRIDATHGRLHVTTMTQVGTSKLVIDLERQP